jgi:glycosyltransferase involved in cell wall biosynthesis
MVVHAYYPDRETRVQREAAALVERGHAVDVICLRSADEPARDDHDGVRIRRLPVGRHRRHGLAVQLFEYLAFFALAATTLSFLHLRHRYDVVQIHNLPDFLVFAALVPKLTGTPVLLDLHDLMPEFLAARRGVGPDSLFVRVTAWQEQISCRFADHVITVTDSWKQTLIARGVQPDKISVVMNVADAQIFHPARHARAADGNDPAFHVFYHGTLTKRYGIDLLLDAVRLTRNGLPHMRVTLLGTGDALDDLIAQRHALGLDDRVTIMSTAVDITELVALIREADVGVVPNRADRFTDGILPTKLMEYVSVGIPVIAARTTAISSYFDDDMVEFFEPGDREGLATALRKLAADPARRQRMVQAAEQFVRKYDSTSTAAQYVGVVEAVSARSGQS